MADEWGERRRVSEASYQREPTRFEGEPTAFCEWAIARLKSTPGHRDVVELGAASGRDAQRLAEAGYRVRAVEFAPTAIDLAVERHRLLREPARSRLTVVEAEATQFLGSLAPESQDAVYARFSYHGFQEAELAQLFLAIHRVLRPGGLHLYAVRDTSDPHAKLGDSVGEDTRFGGPHEVAFRYFTPEYCDRLRGNRFDRIELVRVADLHALYVADRRGTPPPEPPAEKPLRLGF